MKWPLHDRAIPGRQIPLYNRFYLHAPRASHVDPVMVWGTEIDADALTSFLRERNRGGRVLLTTAHALIRATAMALAQFPEMNVRVVGRRVYRFRDVNIRMGFYHRGNREIDLLVVRDANAKSLEQIGQEVWQR
ncbi:MAG TPA: 2-oxo acid dehydrogenase subunit E2, partial [Xanthobacteraceae bacterium]